MTVISNQNLITLRNVAKQTGFAKKLFTSGANGMNGGQIAMELRQLAKLSGLNLPVSAYVSLDAAQALLAGGAFVSDVSAGESVLQTVGDASNMVSGLLMLMKDMGIGGEAVSQLADFTALGSNLALAISSGGANILADIGAVISLINVAGDVSRDLFGDKDDAIAQAKRALSLKVHAIIDPQIAFASSEIQAFQRKEITYFDMVGDIALHSPVTFKNFFPKLSSYFPSWINVSVNASASSSGIISSSSDTESANFIELLTNKAQVESVLFNYYVGMPLKSFEDFFYVSRGISLKALSTISMILSCGTKGDIKVTSNFNVLSACRALGVTPGILGDTWLFKGLDKNELEVSNWMDFLPYEPTILPKPPTFQNSGIVINGVESLTKVERQAKTERQKLSDLQLEMQRLDKMGDIESLIKIPEALAILREWSNFHPSRVLSKLNDPLAFFDPSKSGLNMVAPYSDPSKIDMSDYWKCLGLTKQMMKSSLFKDDAGVIARIGDIDTIEENVRVVQNFILLKNLNLLARENISNYTGIASNALGSRVTKTGHRVFYRKAG